MTVLRTRAGLVFAVIGLVAMVGLATLVVLFETGQIGGQTLRGEVRIVESQTARFDRQVHADVVYAPEPRGVDVDLCLELGDAVGVAPGHPIVLYDDGGSVIGQGTLGQPEPAIDESRPAYADHVVCRLPFHVGDVRRTEAVRLAIGSQTRASYNVAALDGRGWYVELDLGS
jgi:hypothetical protein